MCTVPLHPVLQPFLLPAAPQLQSSTAQQHSSMWLTLLALRLALAQAAAAATAAFVVAHILLLFAQRSAGGLHRRTRCRQLALHTGAVLLRSGQLGRDLQAMELDQSCECTTVTPAAQASRARLPCCAVTRWRGPAQ